ncbi:hypothetical protein Tco_1054786 [Tanacetum coccineum]|uniref:Uncharacterized protein n=1 Tax=Tanacetum coccineum TaxID=301880 RepID=A0ABQ5GYV0_9ASTR
MPTHRLAVIHLVDYSSSDHFSSDYSSSSSSSSLSSETSSDSFADALSDSASSHSSSDHSLPASPSGTRSSHHLCSLVPSVHRSSAISERPSHDSSSASLSRKRSKSPVASVPLSLPILGALSYARADLLPSPRDWSPEILRIRGRQHLTDRRWNGYERPSLGLEWIIYLHPVVQVIESVQRDQGHRIVATGQQSADMLERIEEIERDNRRLRDIVDVERLLGLRLVPGGIWVTVLRLFRDYPSIDLIMPNTRSGASRTREGVNEQSNRRMAEALRLRDAVRNLGPLMGDESEQEVNGNEGNGNGGNINGGNPIRHLT